jgi:iron complex outermembrane receptor protein
MKLRQVLLPLALCLLPLSASAQPGTTLSGTITQAENNQPLSGALVVIDELRKEVHAGKDGSYRFDNVPPGQYHVGIRADGYSTRRVEITVGTTPATLNLAIDFDLHFTDVSSVSPTARPQFESYQPTTVLAGQELMKNLETTIGATLSEAPGVAMREFGAAPARPIIRGMDGDRISVLEDGQRMGDLSSQSGDHGVTVNPASAQRIEVVRGPATLLYGANAIGGLVNVITEDIPTRAINGTSGNITFDLGSAADEGGAAVDFRAGTGKVAFHAAGGGRRSGDVQTPEGELTNSQSRSGFGNVVCRGPGRRTTSAVVMVMTTLSTAFHSSRRGTSS